MPPSYSRATAVPMALRQDSRGSLWGRHNARTIRSGMAAVAEQSGITSAVQALASELRAAHARARARDGRAPVRGDSRAQRDRGRRSARGAAREHRGQRRPGAAAAGATGRAPTTWSCRTRRWSSCAAMCAAAFRCLRCCAPIGSATRGCGSGGRRSCRSASRTPVSSPPGRTTARRSCSPTSTRSPTSWSRSSGPSASA